MAFAILLGLAALATGASASPTATLGGRQAERCVAATFTGSATWPSSIASIRHGPELRSAPGSNLPYCYVEVTVRPSGSGSAFAFGLGLPDAPAWAANGNRFLAVGNGAYFPNITWVDLVYGTARGFVTVSTDTGHAEYVGDSLNLTWAEDRDKLADFARRSLDFSVDIAKTMARDFYQRALGRAYYMGCSTGGRQGLKQVQDRPDAFDGVLIGAPAWDHKHYLPWVAKVGSWQVGRPAADRLNETWQFDLLYRHSIRSCDTTTVPNDPRDSIIMRPEDCHPPVDELLCADGRVPPACLLPSHVEIAKLMYANYTIDGRVFFPGALLPGSEPGWTAFTSQIALGFFNTQYQLHFLDRNDPLNPTDPPVDWNVYEDRVGLISERQDPGMVTADHLASMAAYRARGGKIIMYHGLADAVIPPGSSDDLYRRTQAALAGGGGGGGDVTDFFRYFKVPAMGHCVFSQPNGESPWWLGGANQNPENVLAVPDIPFYTKETNALLALIDWVEGAGSQGPSQIVTSTTTSPIFSQRPVCLFDRRAEYQGGNVNSSTSWMCPA
ncbi:hypothetical protein RB595_004901 [Gaeumannomyces hyphopodioides]